MHLKLTADAHNTVHGAPAIMITVHLFIGLRSVNHVSDDTTCHFNFMAKKRPTEIVCNLYVVKATGELFFVIAMDGMNCFQCVSIQYNQYKLLTEIHRIL